MNQPTPTPSARPVLTGRALVLGAVLLLLIVLLASPINRYLGSRADVSHASQQLHNDQRALEQLQKQQARWGDPGYIQQQARARLEYAMPGDTVYIVVNKGQTSDIQKTAGGAAVQAAAPAWNSRLMDSIRTAAK